MNSSEWACVDILHIAFAISLLCDGDYRAVLNFHERFWVCVFFSGARSTILDDAFRHVTMRCLHVPSHVMCAVLDYTESGVRASGRNFENR